MIYEQYQTLKRAQPNVVLLMQVGDFYHAFDGDAQTVAAATRSRCRKVTVGARKVDTCCVPAALVKGAVETLLRTGYQVGLAQPVEEPEPGHAVQRVIAGEGLVGEVRA